MICPLRREDRPDIWTINDQPIVGLPNGTTIRTSASSDVLILTPRLQQTGMIRQTFLAEDNETTSYVNELALCFIMSTFNFFKPALFTIAFMTSS